MNTSNALLLAIEKATEAGHSAAPEQLITLIEASNDPFQYLSDWDSNLEIFNVIQLYYSIANPTLCNTQKENPDDLSKIIELLRWLRQKCTNWHLSLDKKHTLLVTFLAIGQFFETISEDFLANAPDEFKPNDELIAELVKLISNINSISTTHGLNPPIWEQEAIERFEQADVKKDWVEIAKGWRLIEHGFIPSAVITQASKWLDRFSPLHLVHATSGLQQMASVMSIMLALSPKSALRLGAKSDNPYVHFAAVYRTTSSRVNRETLDFTSRYFLIEILQLVSKDDIRWSEWMHVFNLYPLQFPELQIPLGHVLSNSDISTLKLYLDTINLHWSGQDTRLLVADCFDSFRKNAPLEKRQAMWNLAYQRWVSWRFGLNEKDANLTKIARCELDYALVGYFIECIDDVQRQHILKSLNKELQAVEDMWHLDITGCISELNAVLSKMQPLFLAIGVIGTDADWIEENKIMRLPFDPDKEIYHILKYGKPQIY